MAPATNSTLLLILIALGVLGIIMSFLVQDKTKYLISIVLSGIIILIGAIKFGQQSMAQIKWDSRMNQVRQERQVDLEEMRKKLKERASETNKSVQKK